jgi:hypothetical protein
MKYIFSFILTSLFVILSGCGNEQVQNSTSNVRMYETSEIQVGVPNSWESSIDGTLVDYPNLIFAAQSTQKRDEFVFNMTILKEKNTGYHDTQSFYFDYLKSLRNQNGFLKIDTKKHLIGEQNETTIITYEARDTLGSPRRKFVQTYAVTPQNVYIITITLTVDESYEKYVKLLETLALQ